MTTGSDHRFHLSGRSAAPPSGPYTLDIRPESAGWGHSSLRVLPLEPGGAHRFDAGDSEWIVLPLAGACTVTVDGTHFALHGRESVFASVSDFVYAPRDAAVEVRSASGGRFALAGARCARRLPARYGPAGDVPVELRGAGQCSRQVNNFAAAHVFEADRLIAVEVLTPGGNWSSYPPHKHDESREGQESELEEIYYYEIAPHRGPDGAETPGLGYQRVTPSGNGRGTDVLAEVRGGDAVLIPDGWHGPSMAAPGHDMYYLNVMAGPGADRAWLIRDHPDHAWIRGTWDGTAVDPRLPFYDAGVPRRTAPAGDAGTGGPRAHASAAGEGRQ
ncbi:5-deoxy-glucuronate isomerase [Streptomyces cacaoi]|uniref:5-deoxy-glucuronate isomerase n=1 Tax=Streptomyces cacaoi TaxID=1898 RepID=A0A4Y3R3U2_STRCI|nr:5-deoxy-glucuronate isomerase [Streptomyces cacaoi]NNG88632.1 5-deoxy-glucuronate isomerase [Streptomyces cacaoi]GEB51433.1 5-deoxy-glucuronate isomerase [Streptomyces cacaoi]